MKLRRFLFEAADQRVCYISERRLAAIDSDEMTTLAFTQKLNEISDELLVAAARAGDLNAFSSLVDRYRRVAYAFARARLGSREEAEDVAQEVFVHAYAALGRFHMGLRRERWVMRILRNCINDRLRWRKVRDTLPLESQCDSELIGPQENLLTKYRRWELETVGGLVGREVMDAW